MAQEIKFGTDGWRGVIADDYTFENVRRVAAGIASYVLKHEDPKRGVVIGYDTRFGSRTFAELVAETVAAAGVPVFLDNDYTATPALSFSVKQYNAAGGIMITSSHNPWNWNGIKYKASYGGPGTPDIIKSIESEVAGGAAPQGVPAKISHEDFKPAYVAALKKFVDLDRMAGSGHKFAIDCMYGAGRGILAEIFSERGIRFVEIRSEVNPLFPGINPEPIQPNIDLLAETVLREKCQAGLCTDGDADRIGAIAEDGSFVDAHKIFSILLRWLLEYKKWPGEVVKSFNTTRMIDRICRKYDRKLNEVGIGFKYVCELMLEREILIGGEESGGIGITRHLPERDGLLNCLLLAEIMGQEGRTLAQLVADLQKEFGEHHFGRRDLHIPDEVKNSALKRAAAGIATLGRFKVIESQTLDGYKFVLDAPVNGNGATPWILMRGSGTEPLLRVYAEAASPELVEEILVAGEKFVKS